MGTEIQTVKPFVIGRKNRLFFTSPKGADAGAAAYSIINQHRQTALMSKNI